MLDPELLRILCCPETHQALRPAEPALVEKLNQQIADGVLRNHDGMIIKEKMAGGLIRRDGKVLYIIQRSIPVMLIEEAIPLT